MKWNGFVQSFITGALMIAAINVAVRGDGAKANAQETGVSSASSALAALEGFSQRAEDMRESSEETKKAWEALLKAAGNGELATISEKTTAFLKILDFTEPYQKLFATLMQRLVLERETRDKEIADATNRLATARLALTDLKAKLSQKDTDLANVFKTLLKRITVNGASILEQERATLLQRRQELEAEERKCQSEIQGLLTESAKRRSKLRADAVTYLRARERNHHYQAEEGFANGYLAVLGEDMEISQIAQDAREIINVQIRYRALVNAALADARKKFDQRLLWQALDLSHDTEETLIARVSDRLAQDMIKTEINLFKNLLSRQISAAKERAKVIESTLGVSNSRKAIEEWERFQKEFPDYPDRMAVDQRIVDTVFAGKVSKFEQAVESSLAQAAEMLKQPCLSGWMTKSYFWDFTGFFNRRNLTSI